MLKMEEDNVGGIPNEADSFDLASWSYSEEGLADDSSLLGPYENSSDYSEVSLNLYPQEDFTGGLSLLGP